MKRKTRVFLIAAGVIVLIGALLCLIGASVAKSRGEQLFPDKSDGGKCYTYKFGGTEIGKISISAVNAQINIIGNSKNPKIEVINFNENLCSFTNSNATVTFRENPDISSTLKFWESGFTFKGLRYLFWPGGSDEGGIINIYISKDMNVSAFDLSSAKGKISISDINTPTDYNLSVGTGNISLKNVTTDSTLTVIAEDMAESTLTADTVSAANISVTAQKLVVKTKAMKAHVCEFSVRTGNADIQYLPPDKEKYTVYVESKGKILVDGEEALDVYNYDPNKNKAKKKEDEERASVVVKGNDLSVNLDTPVGGLVEEEES